MLHQRNYKLKSSESSGLCKSVDSPWSNCSSGFSLVRAANGHGQEVLEANGNGSILLGVTLPEGLRKTLDLHAEHYELIYGNLLVGLRIALLHQEANKIWSEAETHLGEGCGKVDISDINNMIPTRSTGLLTLCQLLLFDMSRVVLVIGLEDLQPLVDVVV